MQAGQNKLKQELAEAFGKVLVKLREKSKRSIRSTALEVGLSKTTLILAEQGKLDPQISTFCKIAEAYYIKPEELFRLIYKNLPDNWSILED